MFIAILILKILSHSDSHMEDLHHLCLADEQIYKGEFQCPSWFSSGAKRLISRILTPNPKLVCVDHFIFTTHRFFCRMLHISDQ